MKDFGFTALAANPPPAALHSIVEVHKLDGAKHVGFGSKTVVIPTKSKVAMVKTGKNNRVARPSRVTHR